MNVVHPLINRDYHMTFFITDPSSALDPDIPVRDPVGSRADMRITDWWGIWLKKKGHVMILFSYTWQYPEIDGLQCDTDYNFFI